MNNLWLIDSVVRYPLLRDSSLAPSSTTFCLCSANSLADLPTCFIASCLCLANYLAEHHAPRIAPFLLIIMLLTSFHHNIPCLLSLSIRSSFAQFDVVMHSNISRSSKAD